jgi:probable F420-dependent oxidoreductase
VKVRIGYGLGTAGGHDLPGLIDALEQHGFDSLWLSEQITGGAVDPLIGLAYAAGRTEKLKFGTSVLVVPGRNPALLAKELASLDVLSNGRLLPAVGLGARNPMEHQAFGVDRKERAAWFDEALPLIRRFWTEDAVDHDGPRFHYEGMRIQPKPVQQPPDVWLGGLAPSELRRVGRLGDGWLPSFCTPADVDAGRPIVEKAAAEAGRQMDPEHWGALIIYGRTDIPDRLVQIIGARRPDTEPSELVPVGGPAIAKAVTRFVDVGFSKFVLIPAQPVTSWDTELEQLAADVLPLQRSLS